MWWLRFPYKEMAGTPLGGYKRRPSPLFKKHILEKKK
jgi:hypothetical protein